MVTFAVPRTHDIAHAVLGLLLDRANLKHVHLDGGHDLTISLVHEDVALLQELGVIERQCEELADEEFEELRTPDDRLGAARSEFEAMLAQLQRQADRSLTRARLTA